MSSAAAWRRALSVYQRPEILTMLLLGFAAGLPYLLTFSTLSTWLRNVDVDITTIGFMSWIGILYSIKLLWAPLMDRLALPWLTTRLGQRRSWILVAQIAIAISLGVMASIDPAQHLALMIGLALVVAFSAATQDIVIDAYRIEAASVDGQAAMSSVYTIGYRLGVLVAGAGALTLASLWGWSVAYGCMALFMLVGIITVLCAKEPERPASRVRADQDPAVVRFQANKAHWPAPLRNTLAWLLGAIACPFLDFLRRYRFQAFWLLLLIGTYRLSDMAMAPMANPLYVDVQFSLATIGQVSKIFGVIMTLAGGLLGGVLVARFGLYRLLAFGTFAAAFTNVLYVLLALSGPEQSAAYTLPSGILGYVIQWMLLPLQSMSALFHQAGVTPLMLLVFSIAADNLASGLAGTILVAFLSSLTSQAYTATQFALFSSMLTLPGKLFGGFSGQAVHTYGYPVFFLITALMGIPAVLLAIWLGYCGQHRHLSTHATADIQK